MKGIRRVIAVFVMMAMVIGVAPFSGKEVSATENFRITAPESNSLIGAGHFDIKWTNSETKNVKTYRVYMDKKKVGETTDNKLDCYTTKVATHSAYVEVEYVDGTSDKTATISFAVSKKGLGLATDMGAKINLKDMKCSWYYNWGNNPSSGSQYQNVEFVPMLWRERNQATIKRKLNGYVESGYKYVLAFNEPDMSKQCNMSVDEVFNLWPAMMNDNINVSSPVTATWPTASEDWFIPFMEKIDADKNLDVDFISIHCYPDGWDGGAEMATWFVTDVVDKAWEKYHKPIWITEFSKRIFSSNAQSAKKTAEFWKAVMPLLDEREYVERYAGFCFNNEATGLWLYNTGKLTEAGEVYRNYGNPKINNDTKNDETTKKPETTTKAQVPIAKTVKLAKAKIVKAIKSKKSRKVRIALKKVKKATKYQVQISKKKSFKKVLVSKTIKKVKFTFKSRKLSGKILYVRARAIACVKKTKVSGKWSKVKKVKITGK